MKKDFRILLLIGVLILQVSCTTTGVQIENVERPIGEIRQIVVQASGEPASISPNGREIKTKFYSRKFDPNFSPTEASERLQSMIFILGDRRPYTISVQTFRQKKIAGGYSEPELDPAKSKEMALTIQMKLSQSRAGKNFIDDFRPF